MELDKWDFRFMFLAKEISTWSKDPSTQIGAVYVKDRRILSTGYNGFPQNIEDTNQRLKDRETKYSYIVHAEMNGIYNATQHGVRLAGSTLYVYGLPVCSECAKGVIQVGVERVVVLAQGTIPSKWMNSWNDTVKMFNEAGVVSALSWDE